MQFKTIQGVCCRLLVLAVATMCWHVPASAAQGSDLATLTLTPVDTIMTVGKRIGMEASLKAKEPITLCLFNQPLAQFDWNIAKIGEGTLPLEPLVVNFAPKDPFSLDPYLRGYDRWIKLKPGDVYTFRLLLNRLTIAKGYGWRAGEYRVSATFHLCDPDDVNQMQALSDVAPEPVNTVPIKARLSARFLLID